MNSDITRLSIPAKPEYLVTARLVAASVAGQAGFDMDEIDDIKTACSEACLLLLPYTRVGDAVMLEFSLKDDGIHAAISAPYAETNAVNSDESEFSMFMLEALADEVEFKNDGGKGEYRLFKAPLDA